ncbi:MAG TPA: Mrp/NBP35 family ATP-binding protein [Fibrobacteria bacterium]|nr:Mrp/NBP35 family ATP-binding protein [Fibrobacteria bacterium]
MSASVTTEHVLNALRHVQDPDLHRDIVALGFVKNLAIDGGAVRFDVELTTPACPAKEDLKRQCVHMVSALPGVTSVEVTMTAQPPRNAAGGARTALLKDVRHIVAVASGKGGVGKSTATANLAIALANTGAKVGVLDADIYGPSMSLMFGIIKAPEINADKKLVPVTSRSLKVVSMAMFDEGEKGVVWRGPMVAQMIQNFVHNVVWGELDYLLIDMPPGTGDVQLTLTQNAPLSGAVIITTPQDVSVLDAKKGLRMFQSVNVPVLGIVENMSYFVCDGCDKKHYIFRRGGGRRVAESLGVPFLGEVPLEPEVAEGGDAGTPIVERRPGSPAATAYKALAGAVASSLSILGAAQAGLMESFDLQWEEVPEP